MRRQDETKRVIFHTDRGSTYTVNSFSKLCRQLGVRQSDGPGRVVLRQCPAEAFFSSLEWGILSRHEFADTQQAQAVVVDWCYGYYNHERQYRSGSMISPINYENTAIPTRKPHR